MFLLYSLRPIDRGSEQMSRLMRFMERLEFSKTKIETQRSLISMDVNKETPSDWTSPCVEPNWSRQERLRYCCWLFRIHNSSSVDVATVYK